MYNWNHSPLNHKLNSSLQFKQKERGKLWIYSRRKVFNGYSVSAEVCKWVSMGGRQMCQKNVDEV